jgi:hypothetical protein
MGIYHCTNTAEAAHIVWENSAVKNGTTEDKVKIKAISYDEVEDKAVIILEDGEAGVIGEGILSWPGSDDFGYFAVFNLLCIGIKKLRSDYKCHQLSKI